MTLLIRPRPDGPIYEARPKRDGSGWLLVPYYAEPDGSRELTADQVTDFRLTTRRCGGLVVGGDRP